MRDGSLHSRWHNLHMWKVLGIAFCIALSTAMLWILRAYPPTEFRYPPCMLHSLTGLHCPGCGGTRAIGALASGDWLTAVRFNPLLILGLPTFLLTLFLRKKYLPDDSRIGSRVSWFIAVLVIAFFAARNLPSPTTGMFSPNKVMVDLSKR